MNKTLNKILLVVIIITIIFSLLISYKNYQIYTQGAQYRAETSSFINISSTKANNLLNQKDTFIVFIGRSTCPYCRNFTPKLQKAMVRSKTEIYYLDSESTKSNKKLASFRSRVKATTVPNLIVVRSGKIIGRLPGKRESSSQITVAEIQNLFGLLKK